MNLSQHEDFEYAHAGFSFYTRELARATLKDQRACLTLIYSTAFAAEECIAAGEMVMLVTCCIYLAPDGCRAR